MNIDFNNEIGDELNKFNYLIKKKRLTRSNIQDLLILINNVQELLEYYSYDIYDYIDY